MPLNDLPAILLLLEDRGQSDRHFRAIWEFECGLVRYPTDRTVTIGLGGVCQDLKSTHFFQLGLEHPGNGGVTGPPFRRVSANRKYAILLREVAFEK